MLISRVNIKNYKSMKDSGDIVVNTEIYALIGQNNTGKSTVLDAIQCIMPDGKKNIDISDFHDRTKNVVIELEMSGVDEEYIINKMYSKQCETANKKILDLMKTENSELKIEREKQKFIEKKQKFIEETKKLYEIENGKLLLRLTVTCEIKKTIETRTEGKKITEKDLKKILPTLKVIPAIRNPKNESTAGTNSYLKELIQMLDDSMKTNITINGNTINFNELEGVIAKESNTRCETLSKNISKKYSEILGNNDFSIKISSDISLSKGTTYSTKIIDNLTSLESDVLNCGTGYQSMLILSILETYLEISNTSNDYILIIEEPEVYLHPVLQRKMINTLLEISKSNQVLFSTHSAITISKMKANQVGLVMKENGKAKVTAIDIKKVIDELGIRPDDILMKDRIILVEGKDDKAIISSIIEKIKPNAINNVEIAYVGNCDNLKFYANAERIANSNYSKKLLIIRDADAKEPEKQAQLLLQELKKLTDNTESSYEDDFINNIYVIGKHSIESLFMDTEIIAKFSGLDSEICQKAIEIYNVVYDNVKKKNIGENEFKKYYQPKYFLEMNLDKYRCDKEKREKWNETYLNKWRNSINEIDEYNDSDFKMFKTVREEVNKYTYDKKNNKVDYLKEIVDEMSIEKLKKSLFGELTCKIEEFI